MSTLDDLRGRTAVVTGAGSGIGRSLCLTWADEGMDVVVADVDGPAAKAVAAEVEAKGVRALALQCDVSDAAAVEAMADAAYAEFGEVNLLCNNAGVSHYGPLADAPLSDWEWLLGVNLWGVIHGVHTFVPRFRTQDGPAYIVNTASMSGLISGPGLGVYTTSKYAIVAISETLLQELAGEDIGVSVVCPGPVTSRMIANTRSMYPDDSGEVDAFVARAGAFGWIDADTAAAGVRDGVKARQPYIFSHPQARVLLQARFDLIAASLEADAARLTT